VSECRGNKRGVTVAVTDWTVRSLGERTVPSPLGLSTKAGEEERPAFVPDDARVLEQLELAPGAAIDAARAFEKAGPREKIFFEPTKTCVGIVTAGGICPGINNVIRTIVLSLFHRYGVREVLGFRYGYAGLDPASGFMPVPLTPDHVRHIHTRGGTFLGTSRGRHDPKAMLATLEANGVDALIAIGGDGTMQGAHAIAEEAARQGKRLAVVGVPKTIDNDIAFVDKTFGFETAVSMARIAIDAAHTEATSLLGGIGLVKLMGREAGFIAAHATLASHEVNVCLVPEVRFELEGPHGLLAYLEKRLAARGHAVLVVAEGCGKHLVDAKDLPKDASGNIRFQHESLDIGAHLKDRISAHFSGKQIPITIKYIDPSYMVRGVRADAVDAIFCDELARYAVHAAMAGKTDVMVGRWHRSFTHIPLALALSRKKRIDPDKELWLAVMETTGQPQFT
jgi:6-phosphofructokinase 1